MCREPTATGCGSVITIPELKVSKVHATISYDKHEKSFMVQDMGSVNGTFLNKDQRLSEVRAHPHTTVFVLVMTFTVSLTASQGEPALPSRSWAHPHDGIHHTVTPYTPRLGELPLV